MHERIAYLSTGILVAVLMFGMMNVSGETWVQSSTEDLATGQSVGMVIEDGTLKLDLCPIPDWMDTGNATGDSYGHVVASAGDVNGDGFEDVIVGAPGDDDNGTDAGKVYGYYGSGSGLSRAPDWSVLGESAGDEFGYSISSAGDVNGDGYDDVLIGARYNDDAAENAGEIYIYYGSASGLNPTPDWSEQGENAYDYFGYCVAGAGDVNGDGFSDVIIGTPYYGGSNPGRAYLYLGSSTGLSESPNWSKDGESNTDLFGWSVAGLGDVNGDGFDDIMIGAPQNDGGGLDSGEVYVYLGSRTGLPETPDWYAQGKEASDKFGHVVASAGDVNGDGYSDSIVGAPESDDAGSDAGMACLYLGSSTGFPSTMDWCEYGEAADDKYGYSVASAGDIDDDGYDDVIVAAIGNDDAGNGSGAVHVYYGTDLGLGQLPLWSASGRMEEDRLGACVAAAGDVNGDGHGQFIVSSVYNDQSGEDAGIAYLYCHARRPLSFLARDWRAYGAYGDYFGDSVASAGDVDRDGFDDVIVGANYNSSNGYWAGCAFLYRGTPNGVQPSPSWTFHGNPNDHVGYRVSPAGDVNGDGFDDVLIGAPGNDTVGFDSGRVYVFHGSANGLTDTPDWHYNGTEAGEFLGGSLACAGDVNNDGYDDVIVGAWNRNYDNKSNAGMAYLFLGSPTGLDAVSWSNGGSSANAYFGRDVAAAGDVNGDGYDDWMVSASGVEYVYVYHGRDDNIGSVTKSWYTTVTISQGFGYRINGAGDVNGDGSDDVIVGAQNHDGQFNNSGRAYLYLGSSNGLMYDAYWTANGESEYAGFGSSVAGAGDINDDGVDDIIIGANHHEEYGDDSGKVYIYFGSTSGPGLSPDWEEIGKGLDEAFGGAVAGAGDVDGDGRNDIIVGANRNADTGSRGGAAFVYRHPDYVRRGTFISERIGPTGDLQADIDHIEWSPKTQPEGTTVKFQIGRMRRGGDWEFFGPDRTNTSYFTDPHGQDVPDMEASPYWCYRVFLETSVPTRTPTIDEVIITYAEYRLPEVHLFSPNGGEDLIEERSHIVTWTATGTFNSTPVQISYSIDGGITWSAPSWVANAGYYNWSVPSVETATGLIRTTVTDIHNNDAIDVSDMTFAIDPPANWQLPGTGSGDGTGTGDGGDTTGNPDQTPTEDAAETGTLWIVVTGEAVAIAVLTVVLAVMFIRRRRM